MMSDTSNFYIFFGYLFLLPFVTINMIPLKRYILEGYEEITVYHVILVTIYSYLSPAIFLYY